MKKKTIGKIQLVIGIILLIASIVIALILRGVYYDGELFRISEPNFEKSIKNYSSFTEESKTILNEAYINSRYMWIIGILEMLIIGFSSLVIIFILSIILILQGLANISD